MGIDVRRSESVEDSYDTLVTVFTGKDRLDIIAAVNRAFNRDVLEITRNVKQVLESLEEAEDAMLMLVAPSNYLLMKKLGPGVREPVQLRSTRRSFASRPTLIRSSGHQSLPVIGWPYSWTQLSNTWSSSPRIAPHR